MTYPIGAILLIRGYQLPTKVKDKFFIVVSEEKNEYNLLSMTTSQVYFDESMITHGIIKDRDMSLYCFEEGRIIGKNGFAFRKNTFVSHRSNIHHFTGEKIEKLNIEVKDELTSEEIINLVYSFYSYKGTAKKYKEIFEQILNDLFS